MKNKYYIGGNNNSGGSFDGGGSKATNMDDAIIEVDTSNIDDYENNTYCPCCGPNDYAIQYFREDGVGYDVEQFGGGYGEEVEGMLGEYLDKSLSYMEKCKLTSLSKEENKELDEYFNTIGKGGGEHTKMDSKRALIIEANLKLNEVEEKDYGTFEEVDEFIASNFEYASEEELNHLQENLYELEFTPYYIDGKQVGYRHDHF